MDLYQFLELKETEINIKEKKRLTVYFNQGRYASLTLEYEDYNKNNDDNGFCYALRQSYKRSGGHWTYFPMKGYSDYVQSFKSYKRFVTNIKKRLSDIEISFEGDLT